MTRPADRTFRDYLVAMAAEADLPPDDFRPLSDDRSAEVARLVEGRFGDGVRLPWWGTRSPCDLPTLSHQFPDDSGWAQVGRIAPDPEERAWFIAENWGGGTPRCYVFEARSGSIGRLLGNSHHFEYLLASRGLDWIIAEDHHGVITAVGDPVVDRLKARDDGHPA